MPMPDNGFKWRPNDNSAKTNLRYTLEAEKWVNAVSSAQRKAHPRSISGDLAFIGMVVQLILCVVLLIVLGVLQLVKALIKLIETSVNNRTNNKRTRIEEDEKVGGAIEEEFIGMSKKPDKIWTIKKEKQYPTGWQLIFWTKWGRLRHIWQFIYLFVSIYLIIVVVFAFLQQWFPTHFQFSKEMFIFIGAVSLWNAFLGVE